MSRTAAESEVYMDFFNSAVGVLQTLVIALGAGLGIWGAINLMEGYGNDNPGANDSGDSSIRYSTPGVNVSFDTSLKGTCASCASRW